MDKKLISAILVFVAAGALAGCAGTKQLKGIWSAPGGPAENIKLEAKPNAIGDRGTLFTTLPGGESFSGKYTQIVRPIDPEAVSPTSPWFKGSDFRSFKLTSSDRIVAMLSGDRGNTMRCDIHLSSPPEGLSGKSEGSCRLSDGGEIEISG